MRNGRVNRSGLERTFHSGYDGSRLDEGGFSMIELVLVFAVVMGLSVLFWSFTTPGERRKQRAACGQNLQRLSVALGVYTHEHDDRLPHIPSAATSGEVLDLLVPKYTVDTSLFTCPGSRDAPLPSGESIRNRTISYAYYMGRKMGPAGQVLLSDRQVNTLAKIEGQYAFSSNGKPPGNNHRKDGGMLLFCDGHCERSPARLRFALPLPEGVVLLNP